MWSEEELREIEPDPPPLRTGAKSLAGNLRQMLAERNQTRARLHPHELSQGASPSVIYTPGAETHGNFIDASYRAICARPGWRSRLVKAHTSKRQARPTGPDEELRPWCELDSANSSDALLMNIFCYPRVLATPRLPALLGIEPGHEPIFGYPARIPLARKLKDRTEIDLRLDHLLIEAKLTESDFQFAPLQRIERYLAFEEVFDPAALEVTRHGVRSYQLIRGVLAAHALSAETGQLATFCVLLDARRPDLIEAWYAIIRAVRSFQLQSRLRLLTWQEIAANVPLTLRVFLADKYGIEPCLNQSKTETSTSL